MLVALVFLTLFGFAASEASAQLQKTVAMVGARSGASWPLWIAKEARLYAKYGLDVEIIQIRSNLQLAGLVAGELDFITGIGTAIEGIGKGMPVKAVK